MRTLVLLAVVAAAAVSAAPALAATRTVKVGDDYFGKRGTKPTVTVGKGTRVVWKWVGDSTHNVRAYKGPRRFESTFKTSGTYERTFSRKATYRLVCDVHRADMRMTLKVR